MLPWAALLLLLLLGGCGGAHASPHGSLAPGAMTEALTAPPASRPHLADLHDALLEGRPSLGPGQPRPLHRLALYAPRGQEHQAAAVATEWQDGWADRSAAVVREAADDDDEVAAEELAAEQEDDGVAMSPSWLRGARRSGSSAVSAASVADDPDNALPSSSAAAVSRSSPSSSGSLEHFRRKRSPRPGPRPNEASSEDAAVAADSSKRGPPSVPPPSATQPPQQAAQPQPPHAKVAQARGHQFVTGRGEKEPPPVVREVEAGPGHPGHPGHPGAGLSTQRHASQASASSPPAPPPTHTSPMTAGSSRVGAARDALGLRVNEIPQGPRYGYESETQRYANDHRYHVADNYNTYNSYASSHGGAYGNSVSAASVYPSPSLPPPPQHGRSTASSSSSATPRRIIYYASLPEPAPAAPLLQQPQYPLPGSARVPHEYRGPPGPPYDANAAYAALDAARYPPPLGPGGPAGPGGPGDSHYRYTIIDAEPPGPLLGGYRPNAVGPLGPLGPAPYRDRLPGVGHVPAPAAYPQPYRINPPQQPLQPSAPSPTTDAGPQAATPIQYTQYDYNGIGARTASSLALVDSKQGTGLTGPGGGLPPGGAPGLPGVPLSDDPYRGMNPRQPAPWSMQVGTRLTVKDDGYGNSPGLPPAARRFYVTSQQQPGFGENPYGYGQYGHGGHSPAPARFPRPLDRASSATASSSASSSRSEPRNRLFR